MIVSVAGFDVGRKRDRSVLTRLDDWKLASIWADQGSPLPDQAMRVGVLLAASPVSSVCVDAGGVGLGMVDMLRLSASRAMIIPVNFVSRGGLRITDGNSVSISHRALVELMMVVLNWPGFSVADDCPYRRELKRELAQLGLSFTTYGGIHLAARQGHDDFAFSFGLAILARFLHQKGYGRGAQPEIGSQALAAGSGRTAADGQGSGQGS